MRAVDELYRAGLRHYVRSLYAMRHFERVIIEKTESVVGPQLTELANAFRVSGIEGGSSYYNAPRPLEMSNITVPTLWAWVGKQHSIPGYAVCFFGVLVWNEKISAAVCFSNYRREFRDILNSILEAEQKNYDYQYYHDNKSGETFVLTILKESGSLDDFGNALGKLIESVIAIIGTDVSLRPAPTDDHQGEGLQGP
jgi:hypothetical protein